MLGSNGRDVAKTVFTPAARLLIRLGVSPDAVTIVGTVIVSGVALWLFPTGHLWPGALAIGLVACTDALDGTMARLVGRSSKWGAFLDSTLDRFADAAVVGGLLIYFARQLNLWGVIAALAALVLGSIVPYARARAEGLGIQASGGIAERSDRLIVVLVAALAVGLGVTEWVLVGALGLVALAGFVTVGQRAHKVWLSGRERQDPTARLTPSEPEAS